MNQQNGEQFDCDPFPSSANYTLKKELGRGGMGIAFLAERETQGVADQVVLKTVVDISEEFIKKLKQEANVASRLHHKNIVKTYGLETVPVRSIPASILKQLSGLEEQMEASRKTIITRSMEDLQKRTKNIIGDQVGPDHPENDDEERQDIFAICMEYVEGTDLKELFMELQNRNLLMPVPLVGFVVDRLCRALAYAHNHIVHRDISPGNVLIDQHGVCKLTDFGVAVESGEPMHILVGKLGYMAPEQLDMEPVDPRADLFSVGVLGYQYLTGVPLFHTSGDQPPKERIETVRKRHESSIEPPHKVREDVPKVLSKIIMKMIETDPDDRFQDAETVGTLLEQKYLYKEGFGPTTNSLKAYLDIFHSGFEEYNQKQLRQLRFLKEDGKIRLRRKK